MVTFKEAYRKVVSGSRKPMEASHGKGWPISESDKGLVEVSYRTQKERVPHPQNMGNYHDWANDPEASTAINVLKDMIAGVGYYTEMDEEEKEDHKNKQVIDEYGKDTNLDEQLQEIVATMLTFGFCPVERLDKFELKVLDPETFFIYQDLSGNVLKYTQERSVNDTVAKWETEKEREDIILFIHNRTPDWPYGRSLVEPIGTLIEERLQMNKDMPKAIHRWAYPIPIMETSRDKANLQKACEERDVDEWIYVGNVNEGEVRWNTVSIDPQARFVPYIELIYYQICEGLHAPLLLYLKNATEASANVMMESIDRLVNGIQRYMKRRVEKYLFEPQVGEPIPRLVWGQPKTGLEDMTLEGIAAIIPYLARNQREDLLKQFGLELPKAEKDPLEPEMPMLGGQQQPFKKPMQAPTEAYLAKIADMATSLDIIYTNFREGVIKIKKAMKMGGRVIEVHLKLTYGGNTRAFEDAQDLEFKKWVRRLIGVKQGGKKYEVIVPDS